MSQAGRAAAWGLAVAQVALFAAALMVVAIVNGRPSAHTDTAYYYSQGEYFVVRLLGAQVSAGRLADPTSLLRPGFDADARYLLGMIAARPPTYGIFLYASERAGTLWATAALQCLAAAAVVRAFVVSALGGTGGVWLAAAVLSAGASLPFFATYAMPDVFAALAVLCTVLLMLYRARMGRLATAATWAMLAASASFHPSTAAIPVGLLGLGALAQALAGARPAELVRRGLLVGSAVAVALAANPLLLSAYRHDRGAAQSMPPFLMARLLADGPGRAYLRSACPGGAAPALCRFAAQPLDDEAEILWSGTPGRGVYGLSDYAARRRIKAEEPSFVAAVVAHDPLGVLAGMARNTLDELQMAYVVEPLRDPAFLATDPFRRLTALPRIVPGLEVCARRPGGCAYPVSSWRLGVIHAGVLFAAMLLLAGLAWWQRRLILGAPDGPAEANARSALGAAGLLLAAVVINAAVCGGLSGVTPRYEARLIWLVPLAAIVAGLAVRDAARAGAARRT